MSMSEIDFLNACSDYKTFRQVSRDRLLNEMLESTKTSDARGAWKVLIMDKFTLKVMSYSCKMADITDQGISLVEDIFKRREPLTSMDAIYFVQPTKENVIMILSDMSGRCPLYKKAYLFFSSSVPKELVTYIKNDSSIIPRIAALREFNLEYFAIDSQGFVTDQEMALEELYGHGTENSKGYKECLSTMGTRIATAFASVRDFPFVRYQTSKSSDGSAHDSVPKKLANIVWECLSKYKSTIPNYPQKENCELLILDRSIDLIAPVIHEWTYEAMCYDLLELDGNKYVQEIPSKSGDGVQRKEAVLEEEDPLWLELRHTHIADASERLHDRMNNFISKNKAAQLQTSRDGNELSTKDLQKMVQALPQYNEQMDKISLHVEIAGKINKIIRDIGLRDIGQLEQDLVFGDAGAKEVISFLRSKQDASPENKLRLLIIYAAVYPDKFDGDKGTKLMQLAKLSPDDMNTIKNLRYLEGLDSNKSSGGGFSLKFNSGDKKKQAERKEKDGEETWALSRFYPMIENLIEKLSKGELPQSEYPYINEPGPSTSIPTPVTQNAPAQTTNKSQPIRSRRTATWAKGRSSDDGSSSDSVLKHASTGFKKMGQRIFIFIAGGVTRSELRVIHKLTSKLKREVILGSSNIDDPPMYITKFKMLKGFEDNQ